MQLAAEHSAASERAVLAAVQTRWATLLGALWASGLEAYARGADTEPPVSRRTFCAALEWSEEVLRACAAAGQPATALRPALQSLGGNLLMVWALQLTSSCCRALCLLGLWFAGFAEAVGQRCRKPQC